MILIGRILATIAALNLFCLAVFVGLATLQYNSILSGLTRERLVVLADTVRGPFQAVADLGVPIGTVRNADAVLKRARLSDESILAIHVFDVNGKIVRSTMANPSSHAGPDILGIARDTENDGTWHLETNENFLVGANISGAANQYTGGVYIEYSRHDTSVRVQAMEARMVLLAGTVFAVSVLIFLIMLRIVLSEHLRIFDGVLSSFDRFERKFWRGTDRPEAKEAEITGLGFSTAEFGDLLEASEAQYQEMKTENVSSRAETGK